MVDACATSHLCEDRACCTRNTTAAPFRDPASSSRRAWRRRRRPPTAWRSWPARWRQKGGRNLPLAWGYEPFAGKAFQGMLAAKAAKHRARSMNARSRTRATGSRRDSCTRRSRLDGEPARLTGFYQDEHEFAASSPRRRWVHEDRRLREARQRHLRRRSVCRCPSAPIGAFRRRCA